MLIKRILAVILLAVCFLSVRRVIRILYHQFDDYDFINIESGRKTIYKDYLIKKTIICSVLASYVIFLSFFFSFHCIR